MIFVYEQDEFMHFFEFFYCFFILVILGILLFLLQFYIVQSSVKVQIFAILTNAITIINKDDSSQHSVAANIALIGDSADQKQNITFVF